MIGFIFGVVALAGGLLIANKSSTECWWTPPFGKYFSWEKRRELLGEERITHES